MKSLDTIAIILCISNPVIPNYCYCHANVCFSEILKQCEFTVQHNSLNSCGSNTDISKYYIKEYSLDTFPNFHLNFNFCYLKLMICQSKFSGTRKFTLRYQYFGMNFCSEIPRDDYMLSLKLRAINCADTAQTIIET